MPRKPPTPITAILTLPLLSISRSLIEPMFSLASLYTLMPSILDVRHSPDAVVVVVVAVTAGAALSVVVVGDCANATVARSAVPARPAAIDFINMLSSPSAENLCGENLADHVQFRSCSNFVTRFG